MCCTHLIRTTIPVFLLITGIVPLLATEREPDGAPASVSIDKGKEIYSASCADCHGDQGGGVEDACEEPLHGDLSIGELATLIEQTMPEGEPEACVGEEARSVAAYVHKAFYSLEARINLGVTPKPRVELVRLTVEQYRNSIADLLHFFTPPLKRRGSEVADPGLQAEYFQSKGMSKANARKLTRVESVVDYDFGEASPDEEITADQFAIIWSGSVYAPMTGFYEFKVRTENGARLYLNNDPTPRRGRLRDDSSVAGQTALIDAWVSSGKMRERTARVFLISGRQYPIRLEFFKYKEKTASIRLEWKRPNGSWALLDHNFLMSQSSPRTFVTNTQFPADDRSLGYERGSSVSQDWHAATNSAAIETVAEVIARLPMLTGLDEDADEETRREQLIEFANEFARAAYRRPIVEHEQDFFRKAFFESTNDVEAATRRALLFILKSPQFLYLDLQPDVDGNSSYSRASRLSYAIWDSCPDEELLTAAANGELSDRVQIEAQARRMLGKPQAREKMRAFFRHWLELDERDLTKDSAMFPEFDDAIAADLRYSLEKFLDDVVWSEASDYRQLLLANYMYMNDDLLALYGQESKSVEEGEPLNNRDEFRKVTLPNGKRAGVLTHPYLLSAFSYHNSTSPIHRGVFVTRNVVGRGLRPPPVAVSFKNEEFAPDLTMREKITQLTRDKACMACHSVINPLGFALENFDAIGRWRTTDNQKPVNSSGEYVATDGTTVKVSSAVEIAEYAVNSEAAQRAFVSALFHHMVKQNVNAYGTDTVDNLRSEFERDDFNIQHLMIQIATTAALQGEADLPEEKK